MTDLELGPGAVSGRIRAPRSKSYTHRALIAGFLSGRAYHVQYPNRGEDCEATLAGLSKLGASIVRRRSGWTVHRAQGGRRPRRPVIIDCRSSGTSLRFLTAVAALGPNRVRFRGTPELARRPLGPLAAALRSGGATVGSSPGGRSLPVTVQGPLRPGAYTVRGDASSQFASAMLLALPTLAGPSTLGIEGPLVSAPYLDATLSVLSAHGIRFARRGTRFELPGEQTYEGRQFFVPGDASSAAYLWAAGALTGGSVRVEGIDRRWPQADLAVLSLLEEMGARVRRHDGDVSVQGPLVRGGSIDLTSAPDLAPLVGVLAALVPGGRSRLTLPRHLGFKESDRRAATLRLARRLGAEIRETPEAVEIRGGSPPPSLGRCRERDHRVLMSAAVGALALRRPSRLGPAAAVAKSFPGFWDSLRALGARVEEVGGG